jgi:hypothetical protein
MLVCDYLHATTILTVNLTAHVKAHGGQPIRPTLFTQCMVGASEPPGVLYHNGHLPVPCSAQHSMLVRGFDAVEVRLRAA